MLGGGVDETGVGGLAMTRGPTLKRKDGKGGRCRKSSEGEGGFYKVVPPGVNGDGRQIGNGSPQVCG